FRRSPEPFPPAESAPNGTSHEPRAPGPFPPLGGAPSSQHGAAVRHSPWCPKCRRHVGRGELYRPLGRAATGIAPRHVQPVLWCKPKRARNTDRSATFTPL